MIQRLAGAVGAWPAGVRAWPVVALTCACSGRATPPAPSAEADHPPVAPAEPGAGAPRGTRAAARDAPDARPPDRGGDRDGGDGRGDRGARPEPVEDRADALASPIPAGARQLVVGVAASWTDVDLTLRWYEREPGQPWRRVGEPWAAAAGGAGLGWGRGLHGDGAPAGRDGPVKRERDMRSPAGAFAVVSAYGYADAPDELAAAVPAELAGLGDGRDRARLPFVRVSNSWRCVDDPASAVYNRVVDAAGVTRDWRSAERMRRRDDLYEWVIEVAHNDPGGQPEPGGGSCIFFHVWSGKGSATAGCTAMTRPHMMALVAALDPGAVYVLLPRGEYRALRGAWGLPAL